MDAAPIIAEVQQELRKHTWDTFVDTPPSMARGGKGVVVPGCPHCRKLINTMHQFMDHIADDILPGAIQTAIDQYQREPGCEG
jgi:hypothetical protein